MKNDKKYNIVLGIMIFLFIVVIGIGIAWGLGYIGIKSNDVDTNINNNLIENDHVNVPDKETENETINTNDKEEQVTNNDNNNGTDVTSKQETTTSSKTNYGLYSDGNLEEMAITPRGLVVYGAQDIQLGWVDKKEDAKFITSFDYYKLDINIVNNTTIKYTSGQEFTLNKVTNNGVITSERTGKKVLPGVYVATDGILELVLLSSNKFYIGAQDTMNGTYEINDNEIKLKYQEDWHDAETIIIESKEKLKYTRYDGWEFELTLVK